MSHDMDAMKGMDMSKPPVAAPPSKPGAMDGMDHSKMKGMTPAPTDDRSAKSAPAPTIYTCVMHSEVQRSTPGNCPKCGMTLVKKKTTAR